MKLIHAEAANHRARDPYQELAIAVIKQAANDYRDLARKNADSGSGIEQKHIRQEMTSISRFFLGDWYRSLSGLDNGADILEMLDMEVFGNDESV